MSAPDPSDRLGAPRVAAADWSKALIFGVLNVTPDSFSDGGEHFDVGAAVAHAHALVADGADWIDIGGESTAPGRGAILPEEEQRRIIPVIRALAADGVRMSVDTFHASTAAAAVDAGVEIVNDVYGSDPLMDVLVVRSGVRYLAMHSLGEPTTPAHYADVVVDVRAALLARIDALLDRGARPEQFILDPGLGFSKQPDENWALIARLDELVGTGYPILIGASRKRFIRGLVGDERRDGDSATAAISLLAAERGAWAVRVHDVVSTRIALDVLGKATNGE